MKKINIVNNYGENKKRKKRFLSQETISTLIPSLILAKIKKIIINMTIKHLKDYYDIFPAIEIETINRCNGTCSFCPVNIKMDKRPSAKMEEKLFRKIIDELAEINYSNYLGLQSNNEPYMDKHIISRIAYAREKWPDAFIHLFTNGTLLNTEKLLQSIDVGLSVITINNYNDDLVLNGNIKKIVENIEGTQYEQYFNKIKLVLRKRTEVLSNRGGIAPNKNTTQYKRYRLNWDLGCISPFQQMVIRPNGEVSLCCQDAYGQITLGDTKKQSLKEIWNGHPYRKLREELLRNGRKNLEICNVCDVINVDSSTFFMLLKMSAKKFCGMLDTTLNIKNLKRYTNKYLDSRH